MMGTDKGDHQEKNLKKKEKIPKYDKAPMLHMDQQAELTTEKLTIKKDWFF